MIGAHRAYSRLPATTIVFSLTAPATCGFARKAK